MTRSLSRAEIKALAAACEAQVAALAAAGKVVHCEADVDGSKGVASSRAYHRAIKDFERTADYTDARMREAENRGTSDIQSERMMLHGF